MQQLTIAVAQPVSTYGDLRANVAAHAAAVRGARARVVAFPELSLTGYDMDAPEVDVTDPRLAPLRDACAATGTVALAGAPVREEGHRYIAVLAVSAAGITIAYRKMWLGGAEPGRFTAGSRPAVLCVDGVRLGLAVCKDTGITRHAADTAALGMDVYVAGVLEHPHDAEVPAERARLIAARHGVWVAIASFAGATGGGYDAPPGGSGIWTPTGIEAARASAAPGDIARRTITVASVAGR